MNFYIKRIYDKAERHDGTRILVDKIWPRGISKQNAKLDYWWKEVAPSNTLRKWFNHDPDWWIEFEKLYKQELRSKKNYQRIGNRVWQERIFNLFVWSQRSRA